MKKIFLVIAVMLMHQGFGQCSFPVQIISKGDGCLGDTLVVKSGHTISSINWLYNNASEKTATASVVVMPLQNAQTVAGGNGPGSALNQFKSPSSVFIDVADFIYVADRSNYRIIKFPPGSTSSTEGSIVAGGNGPGDALNQFQPNAVCVDEDGNIYVADDANSRVLKFPLDATSATLGTVVAGGNGAGDAANQLVNPSGVFIDAGKFLYVVDAFNDRVQKFPPNSNSFTSAVTVAGGNGAGSSGNQFNGPAAVFVDKAGTIYVDDAANNRIQKFPLNSTSSTNGVTIAGGNGFGAASNQLATPFSIWGDEAGAIYVADINNERIQKFPPGSTSFTPGTTVAGGNGQGNAANEFSGPNAVWGDNKGNLYVSDVGNNRIQKFSTKPVKQYLIDTTFIAAAIGTYTAVITDSLGCAMRTNDITVSPNVTPFVTIQALPDNIIPCAQTKAVYHFTARAVNSGTPSYQWEINGKDTGDNNSSFTASVVNGDRILCKVKSNTACAVPSEATSNIVTISFAAKPVVTLQNKGRLCAGLDTLTVSSANSLAKITWYNKETEDTIIKAQSAPNGMIIDTTYKASATGSYYAITTDNYGCTDTTGMILINETTKPQISITASKAKMCAGDEITFTAKTENAGTAPVHQWLVNNVSVKNNTPFYTSSALQNSDAVNCVVYGDTSACFGSDTSNFIFPIVNPLPQFQKVNDISIALGQTKVLSIPVAGNIIRYSWQPSLYLSNASVANPIVSPLQTTAYTLHVLSADSCAADDSIKVIVSSPVLIPAAFSPNGDGLNERFYILGGDANDVVTSLTVFNRQGQKVFQAANMSFGDESNGWDGMYKNKQQPTGTYIYEAIVTSGDKSKRIYKGTVVLIR